MSGGEDLVGKTIASFEISDEGSDQLITLTFTDNSLFTIKSWDYEGFSSGFTIGVVDA